ncbi:SGNH/GDSL hydrolase family protein [Roseobacter sinensis]|uniref:SGNH/GDSL hydrolase family protein n=1 Tax=Roseobacter sinensis TaxID=2931391 RepID=A0ABT3BJT7_9RHOB|nr:SGNH/GDSL hydrolase family protein [Roseobacter sp. WL0113]MCV3273831.1 SGNH/GDSL hydrolase family protein [Roseobacter sp. WL0113]
MKSLFIKLSAILLFLAGCGEYVPRDQSPRILAMGDSMMAWHAGTDQGIADGVEQMLQEPVIDRSVVGARIIYHLPITGAMGLNISKQYVPGNWEWVIINGGGNDLWLGCGCSRCDNRMNRMISADGQQGEIARMVRDIRRGGAQVIYVGYLRSPGVGSIIEHCRDEGNELESRINLMAKADPGVHFVSLQDLVPYGDRSFHGGDRIHPSKKATDAIARRIVRIING